MQRLWIIVILLLLVGLQLIDGYLFHGIVGDVLRERSSWRIATGAIGVLLLISTIGLVLRHAWAVALSVLVTDTAVWLTSNAAFLIIDGSARAGHDYDGTLWLPLVGGLVLRLVALYAIALRRRAGTA
jgi:hypothetical protein